MNKEESRIAEEFCEKIQCPNVCSTNYNWWKERNIKCSAQEEYLKQKLNNE